MDELTGDAKQLFKKFSLRDMSPFLLTLILKTSSRDVRANETEGRASARASHDIPAIPRGNSVLDCPQTLCHRLPNLLLLHLRRGQGLAAQSVDEDALSDGCIGRRRDEFYLFAIVTLLMNNVLNWQL